MPRLSKEEYLSTFAEPMYRVGEGEVPPFDFWDYFDQIDPRDFEGYDCSDGEVDIAYRDPTGRFEHVLVKSTELNVFMDLVLDRKELIVFGHHLLDLNKEYGLTKQD